METLRLVVVLLHLASFALLFGAWAVEAFGARRITNVMNLGMVFALVTGLALAAPWGTEATLNYTKIGVKLGVLLVIGAVMGIAQARQRKGETGAPPALLFWLVGILALGNAAVAVLWR